MNTVTARIVVAAVVALGGGLAALYFIAGMHTDAALGCLITGAFAGAMIAPNNEDLQAMYREQAKNERKEQT